MDTHTSTAAEQLAAGLLGVAPLGQPRSIERHAFHQAVEAWRAALGPDRVVFDDATRAHFAKTTLPSGTTPAAVLRPQETQQVQELVRVAHRFQIPLHPISRGKNWGYGDACAPTDGQVIVDLRLMNQIREVNVELGYAMVEPGVSQEQMHRHLVDNKLPLLLDVTGAGPDASIVGNILQRGFGHTPYGDRFRHTSGMEVVLPDGRLLNTGFGLRGASEVSRVFPWGAGPWIDGLFTQSDLGIVTAACIWLMPKPEVIEGFALKLRHPDKLGELVDGLRRLRMAGVVRSTVHVANDLRVISSRRRRPTQGVAEDAPLPPAVRERLRREAGVGCWNLLGALYGTRREVAAKRREVRRVLAETATVRFFRRGDVERARWIAKSAQRFGLGGSFSALVDSIDSAFNLLEGVPDARHLAGARWRAHSLEPGGEADLRDCGLIWVSPVTPMTGEHARRLLDAAEEVVEGFGFDFLVTLTAITDRAMCCVISINYDKQSASECDRARACAAELESRTESMGYYGYRHASVSFTDRRAT